jgi:hypothetical protein
MVRKNYQLSNYCSHSHNVSSHKMSSQHHQFTALMDEFMKQLEEQEEQETQSVEDLRALLAAAEKREAKVKELMCLLSEAKKSLPNATEEAASDQGSSEAPREEEVSSAAEEWFKGVQHEDASYTIAPPEYQAYTGSQRRSYQKARSGGCYILRCTGVEEAAGMSPQPIYYIKNTRSPENVFVKATGLRVIDGKLQSRNLSASGVETIRPIDWDNQKWHEGRGKVDA